MRGMQKARRKRAFWGIPDAMPCLLRKACGVCKAASPGARRHAYVDCEAPGRPKQEGNFGRGSEKTLGDEAVTKPTIDELLARTKEGGWGCMIWTGSNNAGGQPSPKVKYQDDDGTWRSASARRLMYEQHHGVNLAQRVLVTTTCGASLCIHPAHLATTDHKAVSRKSMARPDVRRRQARSLELVKQPMGKLTHEKAATIRARRGDRSEQLAAEFGVSRSLIYKVWNGLAWRDHGNPFTGLIGGRR